jgi:DNA-directed RNA polymerase subunit RPC12/RpoP
MTEEIDKNRYLVCPHCSSQRLDKEKATDSLKECMSHDSYRRAHGAIKQR